jgi:hypothetical protein
MTDIKVEVTVGKVSIACPLGRLGQGCDYGDKGNTLEDGTPLCLGRIETSCKTFCVHKGFISIKK